MTYLFKTNTERNTIMEKPYWCFSEFVDFVVETHENGTDIKINRDNYDIPDTHVDRFDFSLEQHAKLFLQLKVQYADKFPAFFEACESIDEIRSTDPREIIEASHELIHHLFSHEIKKWAYREAQELKDMYGLWNQAKN